MRSLAGEKMKPSVFLLAFVLLGVLLPGVTGGAAPQEMWGVFLVPDVGLVYVRYGEPGGVRIDRTLGKVEAAPEDSLSRERVPYPPELIGRLLREELRAYRNLRGEANVTPMVERSLPPAPVNVRVSPRPSVQPPAPPQPVRVAPGIDEPVRQPIAEPAPPPATAVPVPLVPPDAPVPPVDKELIRRELLLTGFLRTSHVIFETAKSTLLPYSHPILDAVAEIMQEFPAMRIRIEGHADLRGSEEYNLDLSQRRAESVRRYIIEHFDIDESRLEAKGFGEERPLVTGENQTALALNRRVEFRVLNLGEIRGE